MKRILAVLLVMALVGAAFTASALAIDDGARGTDWPQRGGDAGASGYNPTATSPTSDVGPDWITRVGFGQSPVVVDGTVYVATYDGYVTALVAEDGTQRWRTNVGDTVYTGVVAGVGERGTDSTAPNGYVYTVAVQEHGRHYEDDTYHLVAVDAATGERVWTYDVFTDTPGDATIHPLVSAHGLVYVTGETWGYDAPDRSFVTAVDAQTGEQRWEVTRDSVSETLVVGDLVISFDEYAGYAYAYDAATGDAAWSVGLDEAAGFDGYTSAAAAASDGTVYVVYQKSVTGDDPSRDVTIVALDGQAGTVADTLNVNVSYHDLAVTDDRLYAIANGERDFLAIDRATGDVVWRFSEPNGRELIAEPTASSNLVFAGSGQGTLYALDPADGTVTWTFTPRPGFPVWQAIPVGDTVYVGPVDMDHRIYALREGGTATSGPLGGVDVYVERMLEVAVELAGFAVQVTLLGMLSAVVVGVLVGGLLYGFVAGLHLSDAPPRLFAARVFRVPYEDVTRRQLMAAHLLASVGLLAVVAVVSLPVGGLLGPFGAVVALLVVGVAWAVLSYSWLPNAKDRLDRDLRRIRIEWGAVHVVFGVFGGAAYSLLLWILVLLVFQPFA